MWLVYVPCQAGDERVYARLASVYVSLAAQESQGSNPVYIDALSKAPSAVGHPLTPACQHVADDKRASFAAVLEVSSTIL